MIVSSSKIPALPDISGKIGRYTKGVLLMQPSRPSFLGGLKPCEKLKDWTSKKGTVHLQYFG